MFQREPDAGPPLPFLHPSPFPTTTCAGGASNKYAALLAEVARRTGRLVAEWHRVGFVHGVLNTDNMSILGETIGGWAGREGSGGWAGGKGGQVAVCGLAGWWQLVVGGLEGGEQASACSHGSAASCRQGTSSIRRNLAPCLLFHTHRLRALWIPGTLRSRLHGERPLRRQRKSRPGSRRCLPCCLCLEVLRMDGLLRPFLLTLHVLPLVAPPQPNTTDLPGRRYCFRCAGGAAVPSWCAGLPLRAIGPHAAANWLAAPHPHHRT